MLQWFIRFPEFSEFLFHLGNTPSWPTVLSIGWIRIFVLRHNSDSHQVSSRDKAMIFKDGRGPQPIIISWKLTMLWIDEKVQSSSFDAGLTIVLYYVSLVWTLKMCTDAEIAMDVWISSLLRYVFPFKLDIMCPSKFAKNFYKIFCGMWPQHVDLDSMSPWLFCLTNSRGIQLIHQIKQMAHKITKTVVCFSFLCLRKIQIVKLPKYKVT